MENIKELCRRAWDAGIIQTQNAEHTGFKPDFEKWFNYYAQQQEQAYNELDRREHENKDFNEPLKD